MWPEIVARFSVPGLRLVVTYGWEGLRTWDSGPAWQERCDQVEAEVKGRFAGSRRDLHRPAEQAGAGRRADAVRCVPLSLQLLRDLLSDRAWSVKRRACRW